MLKYERLTHTEVTSGKITATFAHTLRLSLRIDGSWVLFESAHVGVNLKRDYRYQARFSVGLRHGKACVGMALIQSNETPLLTGCYLPNIENLDWAFTQLYQTFLRLNKQQPLRIAASTPTQESDSAKLATHSPGVLLSA